MKNATVICVIMVGLLVACGSGGGGSTPKVTVTGNIYNQAVAAALSADIPDMMAAAANTPNSILNAACDGMRLIPLPALSQGETIVVEWTIENHTDNPLEDIQYIVEMENSQTLHREGWRCLKWYDRLSGTGSSGDLIWEQSGGHFYNSIASPALPACESPMSPAVDICDPNTHDCTNPWWSIDFNAASGGCTHASGFVSLRAGQMATGSNSHANSSIDIRPGHLALFQALYNGRLMDEKCYEFEVIP